MLAFLFISALGANDTIEVAPFTELESRGPIDVELTVDPQAPVPVQITVEGSKEDIEKVRLTSRGGTLEVEGPSSWSWGRGFGPVIVRAQVRSLTRLRLKGSGDVEVNGARGEPLDIRSAGSGDVKVRGEVGDLSVRLMGSGDVEIAQVKATRIEIDIAGSGDVELAGRADEAEIDIAGSGSVGARGLVTDRLKAAIRGSGDITVCAKGEIRQRTMGSGDVEIRCRD